MKKINYFELKKFLSDLLLSNNFDEFTANSVVEGLTETSLRGVDSHGVRLIPHYLESSKTGRKNPRPQFQLHQKFPTIALLDADCGFGHAAGMFAIDHCIKMAKEYGTGIVGVANSSHPGAMGSFALKAARQGYLAFAFTHADSLMLSHGGVRPFFGTNPVCFAAPRENEEPFCLDMATSIGSWNKILLAKQNNQMLTEDIAADSKGQITRDPHQAVSVLPSGGYKGVGLGAMVEVLCSLFTGMNFGRHIPSMYKAPMNEPRKLGQFYMVIRSDGCIEQNAFYQAMKELTNEFRAEPVMEGKTIMLPGDKEIYEAKIRMESGIPIDSKTANDFEELSKKYSVPLNWMS